jgi:mono/diheme cytochrome c family protein
MPMMSSKRISQRILPLQSKSNMSMMFLNHARFAAALGLLAAASSLPTCSSAQTTASVAGKSDNILYGELAKVPTKAVTRRNPLDSDHDAVPAGAKLYGLHCAECHGENAEGGKGSKKGPSLRADEVQQATPGALFWLLTNGVVRRGMPVWSKLPEPQRWQLVSYVKSLGAPPASKPVDKNP